MSEEIDEKAVYVIIGGAPYEFPNSTVDEVITAMGYVVTGEAMFRHTGKNGVTTLMQVPPGLPVQIIPGPAFKVHLRNLRIAAMQQGQGGPRIGH